MHWRDALVERIRQEAQPPEKFSHQARLYALTLQIGRDVTYDDDVVFASAWLHDMGVFLGHRPEDRDALAGWNATAYSMDWARRYLSADSSFPEHKIEAVVACIRTHEVHGEPQSVDATLLRDADILEQLGAVAVMRTVSKIGRDTRFHTFADAANVLQRAVDTLPAQLRLEQAKQLAEPRIEALRAFLAVLASESGSNLS